MPSPRSGFIGAGTGRLHYLSTGRGRPVVLLHGCGGMAWEIMAPLLGGAEGHWHLTAFDRPGYGRSSAAPPAGTCPVGQARTIGDALRRMGISGALVVGHSYGAAVALSLARECPEAVGGLMLLAGFCRPEARADSPLVRLVEARPWGALLERTLVPWLTPMLAPWRIRAVFAPNPVPPGFAALPVEEMLRPATVRTMARELACFNVSMAEVGRHFHRIAVPALILAGDADRILPFEAQSGHLQRALPNAELRLLAGVGHMPHHVVPEAVIRAIADLRERVDRHDPGTAVA